MSSVLDLDAQQYSMKELKQYIYSLCFFIFKANFKKKVFLFICKKQWI